MSLESGALLFIHTFFMPFDGRYFKASGALFGDADLKTLSLRITF